MNREVGYEVRKLYNAIRRYIEGVWLNKDDLTPMQGRVLGYLSHHDVVFQRDLEREFGIRRSTASAILQVMERDGLLTREPVAYDARLKRLVMTDESRKCCERFHKRFEQVERTLTQGIPPEELQAFFATIDRIAENMNQATNGGQKQDD